MQKLLFFLLTISVTGFLPCCNNRPAGEANLSLNDNDREFMQKVKEASLAEIKTGYLAQEKGGPEAAYFGSLMVAEHAKASESLDSLARALGYTLTEEISMEDQEAEYEIAAKSGADFDKAYLEMQSDGHKEVMEAFKKEKMSGSHEDVKGFAKRFMPHIKMHLNMADSLKAVINKGGTSRPIL